MKHRPLTLGRLPSVTEEPQPAKQMFEMQRSTQQHSSDSGTSSGVSSGQAATVTRALEEGVREANSRDAQISVNMLQDDQEVYRMSRQHSHSCIHSHSRSHLHSHVNVENAEETSLDTDEQSGSLSELKCIYQWLQKSLPFILILCAKLVVQHALGIAVGIGLMTTFLYANKSIVNQVILKEKHSKLHCAWVLVFLTASSLLLYYIFYPQTLYLSLIFMNPTLKSQQLWDVIWIVGITDFILKFIFMVCKCFIILLPSFIVSFKSKGQWFMFIEEVCQYYRSLTPLPVWARYLSGYLEDTSVLGWAYGFLLLLTFLILPLLDIFAQWRTFRKSLHVFCREKNSCTSATKRQCSEAGGLCSICHSEFTGPVILTCQHIFCEECIYLWFIREKTCPLCRTVIRDGVQKWKDGATASHLQLY
ncbi:E3 ubiquitin-protein ligase RNFT1 [Protopterus annectens]|uniref:E3 ubiquitin-protein ligase RNFT1 n=1 Tax=Protopterus annectens TaxID=7888 RepID=UPI001CFA8C08|nr:E3 ubiquitin-protein ligase RNFT1 [Protopterus annectens]